jgi:hypothetical protein
MNNRQNIQPEINGERGVSPLIAKIRRKLGLTYIVDNPFQVPVAQSATVRGTDAAKKAGK